LQSDSVQAKKDKTKKGKSPKLPSANAFDDIGASTWPQDVSWPTPDAGSLTPSESTVPQGSGWPGFESSPKAAANAATVTPKNSPKLAFAAPFTSIGGGLEQTVPNPPAPSIFNSSRGSPSGSSRIPEQAYAGSDNLVKSTSSLNFEQEFGSTPSHIKSPKQGFENDKLTPPKLSPEIAPSLKLCFETHSDAFDPAGSFAQADTNLNSGFQKSSSPDSLVTRTSPNRPRAQTYPPTGVVIGEQGNVCFLGNGHSPKTQRPSVVSSTHIPFATLGKSLSQVPPFPTFVTSPFKNASTSETLAGAEYAAVDPWGNTYSPSLHANETIVVDPWGYKYAK